ncbi:chemotaxis protein MotB [Pseudorhodobacter antarcticus]|uniref:Chemotaxis protein MotB n=1 Tax=Pseudorhodobacter antarcticus TaxID=1077947 RepID=A0A1H8FV84_9RHOB|nr:peptidoglycan -binding protein [Pseudorhodobacter antarcticus]SEN35626.1 chemotaxis protein MotB [Pseudorhodobacter antarcticus]
MALSRRGGQRMSGAIWPGFVDAMTALLLVLMFVLSIFMIVQSVLRETIDSQGSELNSLSAQVAGLADALGLEQARADGLADDLGALNATLLATQADAAARVADFEAQVAGLLAARDAALGQVATLETDLEAAARLEAAKTAAFEALVADLRRDAAAGEVSLAQSLAALQQSEAVAAELTGQLDAAEAARLVELAAAQALRARLAAAGTELTAMTMNLEAQRKRAEETLTLLAAAQTQAAAELTGRDAVLATARAALAQEEAQSAEAARRMALLNEQIAALRGQLGNLQGLLDASAVRDADANIRVDALGTQLNVALAQVAAEQKRRAEMEAAERVRLEAEAKTLETFRSEFFGQLRQLLAGRDGVRIVGDRFVFSSEVLFQPGSADLAPEGRRQIAGVVATLKEISGEIPAEIDWIIRVDGHTDNVPLSGAGTFGDNWELSQARALSVVRFMQDDLGFPPDRMAATGFGEWQPVAAGNSEAARAQNRRIELKLTER